MKLLKKTFSILLATSLIATPLLSVNATELSHSDLPEYYSSADHGYFTIMDATTIQKYLSNLIEYMPVYDIEEIDKDIDLNTATANLQTAVNNVYSSSFLEDCKYNRSDEYLRVEYQYYDALRVLESPQNYHPTVINFKAHCLNNNLKALFPNIL